MGMSSFLAHSVSYRLAAPDQHDHAALLAATGHGHLALRPLLVAAALTMVIVGLAALAFEGSRGRSRPPGGAFSRQPLALLPLLGFVVQEHLERLVHDGGIPLGTALERPFLLGVLLQIPFALAALLVAYILERAAHTLGRAFLSPPRPGFDPTAFAIAPVGATLTPMRLLALGRAERGPPAS